MSTTTILIIIALALAALWVLGLATRILGSLIHIALVAAVVVAIIAIVRH